MPTMKFHATAELMDALRAEAKRRGGDVSVSDVVRIGAAKECGDETLAAYAKAGRPKENKGE